MVGRSLFPIHRNVIVLRYLEAYPNRMLMERFISGALSRGQMC